MVENIPLNGTMETGSHITFEMDNVKDLRYYIIGIKLDRWLNGVVIIRSTALHVGEKIGEAKVICGDTDTM